MKRAIAVAVPVRNEAADIGRCLAALDAAAARHDAPVSVVALANNCTDDSLGVLARWPMRRAGFHWRAVSLPPPHAHAGWARRLALDAGADMLARAGDLLLSTDADTEVAPDWIARTVAHVDDGAAAVAGRALTRRAERAALGPRAADRLNLLGRYFTALDALRARGAPDPLDPWPRHYFEGGASIALTLGLYRRIGGAPTPPVAEDRALFDAVRAAGVRVRHPLDVRVFTSCRLAGRAPGGMADALAGWIAQGEDEPLHETYAVAAALRPALAGPEDRLTFRTLPAALAEAQARLRSGARPEVQPIALAPLLARDPDGLAQQVA